MLGQLLFVRLKAAEKALKEGRLDEAFRLATTPDLAAHRRGQAVLNALTDQFVERARAHYRAERFAEALMDLNKAEAGGIMKDEIAELRRQVEVVSTEVQRNRQSRHDRLGAVRKRIEEGSLAAGRKMLEEASAHDHAAEDLRREIEVRADDADRLAAAAEKLITQGQMAGAAERLRRARKIDAHHEATTKVEAKLCDRVFENARAALTKGRIGRAEDELACLGDLGDALPAKRELKDLLTVAQQASRCLLSGDHAEARRHLMSLDRLLPKAAWVGQAVKQLRQVEELRTELLAGPLGENVDLPVESEKPAAKLASLDDTVAIPSPARSKGSLPDRLLLLVDGGGSFLVVCGDNASIGRAASGTPADIPIFSDLAERHANIARVDEDYFLFGSRDVEVAGRKTRHQLLRDGLRIVLGRKAKMNFRLPSRKSLTAVLDLSDTTKMPNDVRRVIMFHQHATVGAGSNAHVFCRHAESPAVMFERNGSLWIRPLRGGAHEAQALKLGEPVEICGASLVLEPWKINTPGGAKT
ncbi:MAG: hypothetical protein JSU63_07125 [Phycisphaerales bacterium]|nr:MAG: hypothetical protein JSU63_07125 [Phycisphaerales bacterium]